MTSSAGLGLSLLKSLFRERGVVRLLVKRLAENDNSKNQVYLAGSFDPLTLIPFGEPKVVTSKKGRRVIHAPVRLDWFHLHGPSSPAPSTKLILYPQYPEVRLSGFLRGARNAPSHLLSPEMRIAGRILFLGIRADRSILATVVPPEDPLARELQASGILDQDGTLKELQLGIVSTREVLLNSLSEVAAEGWIPSHRLLPDGTHLPCRAPNCGGLTLEAKLGISSNSRAEPDFHGWEVKQFGVDTLSKLTPKSAVTLFTPEPTDGVYADPGKEVFVRRFGYPDKKGRPDRINFGGRFFVGRRDRGTGLVLSLEGYDPASHVITDPDGGLMLLTTGGEVAAAWPFPSLIEHWNRKHSQAAYVPSIKRETPRAYRYGASVYLGTGSQFDRFLDALVGQIVYYDPGIKLERASEPNPKLHPRSQFRVGFKGLHTLYREFERVELKERQ